MISWIQKTLHTDKWWGKFLVVSILYISYWVIFYLFIPYVISVINDGNFGGWALFIIILLVGPILSFLIPLLLTRLFYVNKKRLFFFHTVLIIFTPIFFLWLVISIAFSNFPIG